MLFINTRPTDRAAALTAALSIQSIEVFELPLLELQAQAWSEQLQSCYQQLLYANVIVVVSPTAVEIGMQYLSLSGLSLAQLTHVQWIAVGEKTAQVLAQYGIAAHVPQIETSEGMLSLPELQQLKINSKIAFWRGEGGRQFMMQHLQQQGMQIINCVLYQRGCPDHAQFKAQQLQQKLSTPQPYAVLISSEASWLNWCQLFEQQPKILESAVYLVLGQRLFALLQQYAQQQKCDLQIRLMHDLKPQVILKQLEQLQGKL